MFNIHFVILNEHFKWLIVEQVKLEMFLVKFALQLKMGTWKQFSLWCIYFSFLGAQNIDS